MRGDGAGSGWRLRIFETLDSTSDFCIRQAEAAEPGGLAVLAHQQTRARGSRGRGWASPAGNLCLSVLLRPEGDATEGGRWAILAAVAVADALAPYLAGHGTLAVKWPNDVLLDGRKLAGILLDTALRGDGRLDWLVLGFGVNLAVAPDVPGRATAAVAQFRDPPSPEKFARALLDRLEHWAGIRRCDGFGPVRQAWLDRAQKPGTMLRLTGPTPEIEGSFAGLGEDGSLLLHVNDRIRAFATGETLLAGGN
jgi:BirA family biotin operon repressor/biotin-[acetyl-CoA-carboxylase] ligase